MNAMTATRLVLLPLALLLAAALGPAGCSDDSANGPASSATTSSGNQTGGTGGSAGGPGSGGSGGAEPCGGACAAPTPLCDTKTDMCVACLGHGDCTDADAARCDGGSCVPCQDSAECVGVAAGAVCNSESCVECALGEESACTGGKTCDLLAFKCVDVAAGSVLNCQACSNDKQCETGHRCIPMEFEMKPHGHYCLKDANAGCAQPFGVSLNKESISGAAATDYCGIEQDLATCEAVLALINDWRCSGDDGMCGPFGEPEQPVVGALCKKVGVLDNRCTYACDDKAQCLPGQPKHTCGTGNEQPPGWCGG